MALKDLLEKGSDADLLRETTAFVASRLMDLEVEGLTGAGHGERTSERTNQRNSYRERTWQTRAGAIDLRIPKLRNGSSFPSFLEPRRAGEKALAAVIQEASVHGVSTRAVDDLVKAMGMTGIWKSQVSRLAPDHGRQLHSTNPLERLNGDVKKRTRVVGIFPNEAVIVRLVGAFRREQNDEWTVTRRYMSLETLAQFGNEAPWPALPATTGTPLLEERS